MKERNIGLDVTRIFAFLCVVSVHSLHFTSFYELPVDGIRMYLLCLFRALVNCCIPLFLLISGYLLAGRTIDLQENGSMRRHLRKCSGLICTYLLAEAVILSFRNTYLHASLSWQEMLSYILGFGGYGWYVNMYLGLYLLMPFVNLLWKNLSGKSAQRKFLLCLLVLTALPSITNVYDYTTPGALLQPWTYITTNSLIPDWWASIYPLTAFFLGAYLREHVDISKLHTGKLLLLSCLAVLLCGSYNIWRSWKVLFVWGIWTNEGSLQTLLCAVLVFLTINSIHYRKPGPRAAQFLGFISELTFGAYLVSWATDQLVYQTLYRFFSDARIYTLCMPLTIASSAVLALLVAFLIRLAQAALFALLRKVRKSPAGV